MGECCVMHSEGTFMYWHSTRSMSIRLNISVAWVSV